MPINKIFFDLDETLVHSTVKDEGGSEFKVKFGLNGNESYYVYVRKGVMDVIDYARSIVGNNNVFILTIAGLDYAYAINREANFGFESDEIFTREDIQYHTCKTAYGGSFINPHIFAHKNNIIIENMPYYDNKSKIDFIGIHSTVETNYLQVEDYKGDDTNSEEICKKMIAFIEERSK